MLGIVKIITVIMKYQRVPESDIRLGKRNNETGSPLFLVDMSWSRLLLCRGCWCPEAGLVCCCEEIVGDLNLVLEGLLTSRQVRNEIARLCDFK